MDPELIAIRMRLSGGKQVAAESEAAAKGIASTGAAAESAAARTAKANAAIRASMQKQIAVTRSVGRGLTRFVTLPMLAIAGVGTKMSIDFSDAMNQIQTQSGATAGEVARMREEVLKFARSGESSAGPLELANALFRLESAGLRGARAMDALRQAEALATVGRTDIELTAQALAGAVKTGIKGTKDYERTVGLLNATVGAGNMRMGDLIAALGTGILPSAKQAGLSLQDVGASLATMTEQNVPAAAAMTRFRMMLSQLQAPTDKAAGALKELGLGPAELAKMLQRGDFLGALGKLKSKLSDLSKVEQGQVLSDIFGGGRTSAGALLLIGSLDKLGEKYDQIGAKAGDFGALLKSVEEEPGTKLEQAWAQVRGILIEVGDRIGPRVADALQTSADALIAMTDTFAAMPGPVQKVAIGLFVMAAAAGPLLLLYSRLLQLRLALMMLSASAGGAMTATAGAQVAASGLMLGLKRAIPPLAAGVGIADIFFSATKGEWKSAGFKAGGAVAGGILGFMLGGPAGAMIGVGIGAMVGGAIAKLDWSQIIGGAAGFALLGPVGMVVGAVFGDDLIRGISDYLSKADWSVVDDTMLALPRIVGDAVGNAASTVGDAVASIPGRLLDAIKRVPRILGMFVGFWLTLPIRIQLILFDLKKRAVKAIVELAPKLFQIGLRAIKGLWSGIKEGAPDVWEFLKSLPGRAVRALVDLVPRLFNKGKEAIGGLVRGYESRKTDLENWFRSLPGKIAGWLAGLGAKLFEIGKKAASDFASGFYDSLPGPIKDALGVVGVGGDEEVAPPSLRIRPGAIRPRRPGGNTPRGASGFRHFRGGLAVVGEEGPELAELPRNTRLRSRSESRRLLDHEVRPAEISSSAMSSRRPRTVTRQPVQFVVDRRVLAEGVVEVQEDEEARE